VLCLPKSEPKMSKFWSQVVRDLDPYVPGEQPRDKRYIKLNTNESPYPPSPKVIEAVRGAVGGDLRLYPDPTARDLCHTLARYYGLEAANVFVGNGSDEVLALAFYAFFKQGAPIRFPDVTYGFYEAWCGFFEIAFEQIPLDEGLQIRVEDYVHPCGGVIVPNPNAQTGRLLGLEAIEALLQSQPLRVVIVDEAYIDFGGQTAAGLVGRYPNLLVVQTYSKSRSLAGMRLGFALGQPELIEGLERAKNAFNSYPIDRLALAAGVAAIEDEDYFRVCRDKVIQTRQWTVDEVKKLGFEVVPSSANFILIRHPGFAGRDLLEGLKARGVLVRRFGNERIVDHLRVTIGSDDEMAAFVQMLGEVVG